MIIKHNTIIILVVMIVQDLFKIIECNIKKKYKGFGIVFFFSLVFLSYVLHLFKRSSCKKYHVNIHTVFLSFNSILHYKRKRKTKTPLKF